MLIKILGREWDLPERKCGMRKNGAQQKSGENQNFRFRQRSLQTRLRNRQRGRRALRILSWGDYSGLSAWVQNAIARVLIKKEVEGDYIHAEKMMWRWGQRGEWCAHKPRNAWSHQKLEKARTRFCSRTQRKHGPVTTWFQISGFQTERINFCYLNSPGLW